ncbi:hypothetical protein AAHA92_05987 [Salvia divinorum]|uniref:Reverse transcriptase domain-containing protein n=1 Tax=Salvia divinorum TaxID=28513 RepID=A0ABD1I470_SALDI
MEFCQTKGPAGSSRPAQLASMEKVLDQENQPTEGLDKNPLPQEENPTKELKKLSLGLKYAHLEEEETMPVIKNSQLTQGQEEELMKGSAKKLNPHMREEVLKEVVTNSKNELVPTRLVTGWRMCIDYRKLNAATKKDHFPLSFIDQMLERLAGNQYFSFLDGYSGYFQNYVDPEDQEKTTFTCPFGTYAYRRMPFGLCNAPGTFQ